MSQQWKVLTTKVFMLLWKSRKISKRTFNEDPDNWIIIEKQERERKEYTPREEKYKIICARNLLVICMELTGSCGDRRPLMQNLLYFSDKRSLFSHIALKRNSSGNYKLTTLKLKYLQLLQVRTKIVLIL